MGKSLNSFFTLRAKRAICPKSATGIFPSGILVGKVIKVDEIEGSQFLNIKIAISENYASLFNSYIIQNKLRDQFKLQKQEE